VTSRLVIESDAGGAYLPSLGLHLDPRGPVPRAFVSHAHADHAGGAGSGEVLGSAATLHLLAARAGALVASPRALAEDQGYEIPMDGGGTARLTVAPAGHCLGASQLVVDHPGGRFVYTGDYQTGPGLTHAAGAPVPCDELLTESTFALPVFRFGDRAAARAALVAWCAARIQERLLPVVLAYALGKSQEIVCALHASGLGVVAHGAVYRMCAAYEELGVDLGVRDGRLRAYADEVKRGATEAAAAGDASGREGEAAAAVEGTGAGAKRRAGKRRGDVDGVLVIPPSAAGPHGMLKGRSNARVAYVSGWALVDASLEQKRADAGFVLSDHADHDDLVAMIRATGARHVTTTFGDAEELAAILRDAGIDAAALAAPSIDEETAA